MVTDAGLRLALAETTLAMAKKAKEIVEDTVDRSTQERIALLKTATELQAEAVRSYSILDSTGYEDEDGEEDDDEE